jgi:hypothetical protein
MKVSRTIMQFYLIGMLVTDLGESKGNHARAAVKRGIPFLQKSLASMWVYYRDLASPNGLIAG